MTVIGVVLLIASAITMDGRCAKDRPAAAQVAFTIATCIVSLAFLAAALRCFGVL